MENNSVVISVEKYDYFKGLEKNAEEVPEGMIRVTKGLAINYSGYPMEYKTYDIKKDDYNKELNDKIKELEDIIQRSRLASDIREAKSIQDYARLTAIERLISGDYPFLSSSLVKRLKKIINK